MHPYRISKGSGRGGGGRTDNLLSTKSNTWHMMRMTRVSCGTKIYNMVETEKM